MCDVPTTPLKEAVAVFLGIVLGMVACSASGFGKAGSEKASRFSDLKIAFSDFDPCAGLVDDTGGVPQYGNPAALPPQAVPSKTSPIYSPGTDAAKYVPGSTAQPFGQFDSFSLGKILLRPSARIAYFYESNLMNLPGDSAASNRSFQLEPSIEAFIPITGNGIRLEYVAAYRRYSDYDLSRNVSHFFNADSQFDFTPLLSLAIREHFALSSLDSQEYVPGREIIFSDSPFWRNDVGAQLNWTISDNDTLGVNGDWNRVAFDEVKPGISADGNGGYEPTPFYDYDEFKYGGFYRRSVSQRTGLIVNGAYLRNLTKDPRNLADSRGFEVLGGIETAVTPLITGQFSIGFRDESFPAAPEQRFRGIVYRGQLQKEFTETTRIGLAVSRNTNPSYFQDNAYYATTGIGLTYTQELGPKLMLSISPGYQKNSYPAPLAGGANLYSPAGAENRVDRLLDVSVDARYRFTDWIALEFLYDLIHRDSVLAEYRFTSYTIGGGLVFGLRGTGRGKAPY